MTSISVLYQELVGGMRRISILKASRQVSELKVNTLEKLYI